MSTYFDVSVTGVKGLLFPKRLPKRLPKITTNYRLHVQEIVFHPPNLTNYQLINNGDNICRRECVLCHLIIQINIYNQLQFCCENYGCKLDCVRLSVEKDTIADRWLGFKTFSEFISSKAQVTYWHDPTETDGHTVH